MPHKNWKRYRTTPHCPKCLIRMFYNNSEHDEYRCGECGKKFKYEVVAWIVGYPKYDLVESVASSSS